MDFFNFLSNELKVIIMAATPVIELKGAIPFGISLGLSPMKVALLAYIGSMIPSPFIILLTEPIFKQIRNYPFFRKQIDKVTHRTLRRVNKVKNFSTYGLLLFVAVPLPTTGIWTGSLGASLLNLKFKNAIIAVSIGNLIACGIVTYLSSSIIK